MTYNKLEEYYFGFNGISNIKKVSDKIHKDFYLDIYNVLKYIKSRDILDYIDGFRDIISSIILSEKDSEKDLEFNLLGRKEKLEILKDIEFDNIEKIKEIKEYFLDGKIFEREVSEIYFDLNEIFFGTNDFDEIENNFLKEQRKNFRFSIFKVVDHFLRIRRLQELTYTKEYIISYLEKKVDLKIKNTIDTLVEFTSMGVIVSLTKNDFINFLGEEGLGYLYTSNNLKEIGGKIIFVCKTDSETDMETKIHEISHLFNEIFFKLFFDYEITLGVKIEDFIIKNNLNKGGDVVIPIENYVELFISSLINKGLDEVKDELIAYFSEGKNICFLENLGFESFYVTYLNFQKKIFEFSDKLDNNQIKNSLSSIKNAKNTYIEKISYYNFLYFSVEEYMKNTLKSNFSRENLSLIFMYFINKSDKRLLDFVGINKKVFLNYYKDYKNKNIENIKDILEIGQRLDEYLEKDENYKSLFYSIKNISFDFSNNEYLKILISLLNFISKNDNVISWIKDFISQYYLINSFNEDELKNFRKEILLINNNHNEFKNICLEKIEESLKKIKEAI